MTYVFILGGDLDVDFGEDLGELFDLKFIFLILINFKYYFIITLVIYLIISLIISIYIIIFASIAISGSTRIYLNSPCSNVKLSSVALYILLICGILLILLVTVEVIYCINQNDLYKAFGGI